MGLQELTGPPRLDRSLGVSAASPALFQRLAPVPSFLTHASGDPPSPWPGLPAPNTTRSNRQEVQNMRHSTKTRTERAASNSPGKHERGHRGPRLSHGYSFQAVDSFRASGVSTMRPQLAWRPMAGGINNVDSIFPEETGRSIYLSGAAARGNSCSVASKSCTSDRRDLESKRSSCASLMVHIHQCLTRASVLRV